MIPKDEWELYAAVIDDAQDASIPFALGGAFAVAAYTGAWRNTKDLDLYVTPPNRGRMVEVLSRYGFTDYFESAPYDRWWIYRGFKEGTIIDIIWATANHRAQVDDAWISGPEADVRGRRVRILPVEVMLQDKLYIMQRERCDWPDVLNLLYSRGSVVDWEKLLRAMKDDLPVLAGALSVFRWIAPGRARELPGWLWKRLGLQPFEAESSAGIVKSRVDLMDRRPWFGPERQPMKPAA